MATSETAHSPWIPDRVPGSSPVCFGSVSNRPGFSANKAALDRSVSSGACPLALSTFLCLALPSMSERSQDLLLCIFPPNLGPVNWRDHSQSCVQKKNVEVTDTNRAILSVHEGCGNGSMIVLTPDGRVKSSMTKKDVLNTCNRSWRPPQDSTLCMTEPTCWTETSVMESVSMTKGENSIRTLESVFL